MTIATAEDVLRFWFEEIRPAQWWDVDAEFDRQLALRFAATHAAARPSSGRALTTSSVPLDSRRPNTMETWCTRNSTATGSAPS